MRCLRCRRVMAEPGRSYCRSCMAGNEMERGWDRIRAAVLARDGGKCVLCGSSERVDVDHIVPRAQRGRAVMGNLRTVCASFNRGKGTCG